MSKKKRSSAVFEGKVTGLRADEQKKSHQLFLRVKLTDLGADEQKNSYATGVLPPHGKSCLLPPVAPHCGTASYATGCV